MAKFSEYKEMKFLNSERLSCAEVLAAMDCLMHHLNDEDAIACWLQDGVPDNDHWRINDSDPERAKFYYDMTGGMTYGDFEEYVKIFACAVKSQCFKTSYLPRSFT